MTRTDRNEFTEGWLKPHGQHRFTFTEVPIHFSQEVAHFPRAFIDVYVHLLGHRFFAEYSALIDFATSEIYLRPRNAEDGP